MSAIISAVYVLNHNLDNNQILQDGIENLPPCRWDELLRMSPVVARESIRLLEYLPIYPPMLLCYHGAYIAHDPMLVNPLAQIWIEKQWEFSIDFVYSIHSSYHGWKLLHRFNTGNCTSQQIFQNIVDTSIPGDCSTLANHCALLGVNGSALEYLMYLDEIHGNGIASTIHTIDRYALRDIVVDNPAASPIIDYILDADDAAREWLIPLICENEIASNYITVEDMKAGLVEDEFFSNPYAIDIFEKWIADSDISHNYVIGLVDIASSHNRDAAKKAMEILDRHQTVYGKHIAAGFSDKLVSKMLLSPHAKSFIIKKFENLGRQSIITMLLHDNHLLPYWNLNDNDTWIIENLNLDTIANVNEDFYDHIVIRDRVHCLSHDNWIVLLNTQQGVNIALNHIAYLIDCGALYALLVNPFVSKDQLIKLFLTTDVLEYCDDGDIIALVNRPDVYEADLQLVSKLNHSTCLNILSTWYNPDRLEILASRRSISLREYLQLYD